MTVKILTFFLAMGIFNKEEILFKIEECVKFREYETSIFYSLYLAKIDSKYMLLAGILSYLNGEFSRCLTLLHKNNSKTSIYYKALSLYNLKQYSFALKCIKTCKLETDECTGCLTIDNYILHDAPHFFHLLNAKICVQLGQCEEAIENAKASLNTDVLLPVVNLLIENKQYGIENSFQNNVVFQYYKEVTDMDTKGIEKSINTKEYTFFDSYYLFKNVLHAFKTENIKEATNIFNFLRTRDKAFIQDVDFFSAYLWKYKNENMLGLLAKEMMETHPQHEKSWIVMANYYSNGGKMEKTTKCLEKSLSIKETAHALTTLGYEYVSKAQASKAKTFFETALKMQMNNSKAYFGLGMSFNTMGHLDDAEKAMRTGIFLEPMDSFMQTFLIRFLVASYKHTDALEMLQKYLRTSGSTIKNIANELIERSGSFKETEELMILEFLEICEANNCLKESRALIKRITIRTSSYYEKKSLIENGMV